MRTFDWSSYLDVAEYLLRETSEGVMRATCSRAYYGVFCPIRDRMEIRRGNPFPASRSIHRLVIQELRQDPSHPVAELGRNLDRLQRERNLADYAAGAPFSVSRARKSISLAREIQGDTVQI